MPNTMVARFDAPLEQMGLHIMTDSAGSDAKQLRPSKGYFLRYAGDGYTAADMDAAPHGSYRAGWLTWMHWHEQTQGWLRQNATLYTDQEVNRAEYQAMHEAHRAYQHQYQADHREELTDIADDLRATPDSVVLAPETVLWWWDTYGLLQWDGTLRRPGTGVAIPDFILNHVTHWYVTPPYPPLQDTETVERGRVRTGKAPLPKQHDIPSIVDSQAIRVSSNIVFTGAMNGIHCRFPSAMADLRPAHIYKTPSSTISFLLDDPKKGGRFEYAPAPEDVMTTLLTHQKGFSALDVDVLMAIDAQVLLSGQDTAWVNARAILEHRGIKPKQSALDSKRWVVGARMWGIEDISSSVDRIDSIYLQMATITTKGKGGGRRPYLTHESKLVRIDERITQHTLDGRDISVEWLCRHGTWREEIPPHLRNNTAQVMLAVLQYDPYHEPWEKKIGQYLVMHQRIGAHNTGPLKLKIRTILDRVNLPEGGISRAAPIKHPDRTIRAPFEKGIDRLCRDGVIADCLYPAIPLPARGWLNTWADQVVTFIPTTRTNQQYHEITARAEDHRNRAIIAAQARKNKAERIKKESGADKGGEQT